MRDTEYPFAQEPSEGAAMGLLALMRGISEGYWAAGWLIDLENMLWKAAQNGPQPFGFGEISQRQCDLLRLLSEEAEGWWAYGDDGPELIPLEEWKRRVSSTESGGS